MLSTCTPWGHTHQVLLCPIDRHKLFIILQLPGGTKVSQFVDALPVLPHQAHDVARFDVPVHNTVLTEVVHPCHWKRVGNSSCVCMNERRTEVGTNPGGGLHINGDHISNWDFGEWGGAGSAWGCTALNCQRWGQSPFPKLLERETLWAFPKAKLPNHPAVPFPSTQVSPSARCPPQSQRL